MANLNNYIINSDYPMEKVAWVFETSGTTSSSGSSTIAAQTTLTRTNPTGTPLLLDGIYSFDNWASAYPISCGDRDRYWEFVQLRSTSEEILISFVGYSTSLPFKVRLWGFIPEDYPDGNAPKTDTASNYPFTIDTSKNYMNIYKTGRVTASSPSPATVSHNLGYMPFVRIWRGSNTNWELFPIQSSQYAEINNDELVIKGNSNYSATYYYRIYTNEI